MLWLLPAIFGIVISLLFIYKLNKKKRKNLIKICFSGLFINYIIVNIFSIIRYIVQDENLYLLLSKGVMSTVPMSAIFYFIAPYIILYRSRINWRTSLFFIPAVIITIMVWYPGMVYRLDGSVRDAYGVNPFLELLYAVTLLSFSSIAPLLYFKLYRRYQDKFGSKLKFWYFGSLFGILTYMMSLLIMVFAIPLPLIAQTIPSTIAVTFIVIGYSKK